MSYAADFFDLSTSPISHAPDKNNAKLYVRYLAALLVQDEKERFRRILSTSPEALGVEFEGKNFLELLVERDEADALEQAWFLKSELPNLRWPTLEIAIEHDAGRCADFMLEEQEVKWDRQALRACADTYPPASDVAAVFLKHGASLEGMDDIALVLYQTCQRAAVLPVGAEKFWSLLVEHCPIQQVDGFMKGEIGKYLQEEIRGNFSSLYSRYTHRLLDSQVSRSNGRTAGPRL